MGAFMKSSKFLNLKPVSTSTVRGHQVEVMVSQSNNLMANTALEEWIRRSNSLKHRNLVLLSSNLIHKGQSIKAFFRRNQSSNAGFDVCELMQQADLVLSSLPRNASLVRLPEVRVEDGHNGISISVPLEEENEESITVTLQSIADNVMEKNIECQDYQRSDIQSTRISLVRPDGGWFPGIQDIQKDIEYNIKEIEEIRRCKHLEGSKPTDPIQSK